jgi:hypothetical protein
MGTHSFEGLKVKLGSCYYLCDGEADYKIEDEGIGSYEFWGAKGFDSQFYAVFDAISLSNYELIGCYPADATGEPLQGLTEKEVKLLEEGALEILNCDSDLCSELAKDARAEEPEPDDCCED